MRLSRFEDPVVKRCSGKDGRLANIFVVEFRIFSPKFLAVWVSGNQFHDAPHGYAFLECMADRSCGMDCW